MTSALRAAPPVLARIRALLLVLLPCLCLGRAHALEITDAWARASVPGAQVGAAYLQIVSPVKARLVAVSSPACARVEIHQSSMENGTMRMRQMQSLDLPAGQRVELKPMGTHLMLMDLKAPLKAGERITLELVVQTRGKRSKVPTQAEIRPLTE